MLGLLRLLFDVLITWCCVAGVERLFEMFQKELCVDYACDHALMDEALTRAYDGIDRMLVKQGHAELEEAGVRRHAVEEHVRRGIGSDGCGEGDDGLSVADLKND